MQYRIVQAPTVAETLAERGEQYGPFGPKAAFIQRVKDQLRGSPAWATMSGGQKEALEMIVHKIGRIAYGNPKHSDSWHDIAGYARLGEEEC